MMIKRIIHFLPVVLLSTGFALNAQVYNILHNFGNQYRDGIGPVTDLLLNGNTLYGAAASGGTNSNGTIFKINKDGSSYGTLFSFTNSAPTWGQMVLISNVIYNTTWTGGVAFNGSIFKVNLDGSSYTELHDFSATIPSTFGTNYDGNRPRGGLVSDGSTLYGVAEYGGRFGNGTIFKINTDGSGFAVIKVFSATYLGTNNVSGNFVVTSGTNSDGAYPIGSLVLNGSTLYGTTYKGGNSNGIVYAVQTDGSDFSVLKYFSSTVGVGTNSDGAAPIGGLVLSGDTLYGVTVGGGNNAAGNIFQIKTNGTGFKVLHDLAYNDGMWPHNALFLDGGTLYGTTAAGGTSNKGTIFMLLTNGSNFSVLKNFDNDSGSQCDSKFIGSGNTLYGTAYSGGTGGGVVFGLKMLPQILNDGNFGVQPNGFGFNFMGISNQTAVIELNTNLSQAAWTPLQTNLLIGAPEYFSDTNSGQRPSAFYRLRTP